MAERSSFQPNNENIQLQNIPIEEPNVKNINLSTYIRCFLRKKIFLILTLLGFIAIGIIIFFIFFYLKPKPNPKPIEELTEPKIQNEFNVTTKLGLRMISVKQKSIENLEFNTTKIGTEVTRKTNYAVYFKSEEKHDKYFSKMYTGIVTIESECAKIGNDDCAPKPLVDLTTKSNNLRSLNSEYLKDIPISICIFNMTDNHMITTLKCPESLPDNKRNEIILDLYFFRPPAAERVNKERDNISLNITKEDKKTKIHETNGGYCNLFNNLGSQCTTEMNTILDEEGNLLTYDEQAITIINYDEYNSYKKDKVTKLIDYTDNIQEIDITNSQKILEDLVQKVEPYMKEEIQFDLNEYEDLYNLLQDAKNKSKEKNEEQRIPQKRRNSFRNLDYSLNENKYIKLAKIFSNKITPVQIDIDFKINPGLNSDKIGVSGILKLDDHEFAYTQIDYNFNIQELINKLSIISKAGNYLASELYDKIYNKFEQMSNDISIQIKSLDELFMYYDIYKVFNSTLIEISYKTLPSEIVELSEKLVKALRKIYDDIESGDIKHNIGILGDDIYNYIYNLHELITKIFDNLSSLSNALMTKENNFTRITNYYLNHTSASYHNIIYRIQNIIKNYYINEYEKIYPKVHELLLLLELNSDEELKNQLTKIKNLYNNIKEENFTIYSINETDLETVLSNLDKSYIYPTDIIKEIKNNINEIMNLKDNGYFTSDIEITNFTNSFNYILEEANEVAKKLEKVDMIDFVFDNIMIKFREGYINTVRKMDDLKTGNFTLDEDILRETLFTKDEKNKIETDLKKICDDIIDKIKKEKELYITKIPAYIDNFFDAHIDTLNDKLYELIVILSEEAIYNIQQSFEQSLNSTFDKITTIINGNIKLTKQYFDLYYIMVTDEYILEETLLEEFDYPYYYYDLIYVVSGAIKRTSSYYDKLYRFLDNYDDIEDYLKEQLYFDLITEYREVFTTIKNKLQSIIDNKLTEKYSNFSDFNVFEKHEIIINKLKERIDKYFSLSLFEKKYLTIINQKINSNINLVKNIKNYIYNKHSIITAYTGYKDYTKDLCVSFYRKTCYGCTNCVEHVYFYDNYCFNLSPYEYNYIYLKKINYQTINDFYSFELKYNNFNKKINEQINGYNSVITKFNLNITTIKEEITTKNITNNYLKPLNDWVESIKNQKYENTLLTSVYNYYKSSIDNKLENIFSDIFKEWKKIYSTLAKDIRENEEAFKYSMFEFYHMSEIYKTIIETDLMENYFNSIIIFEKSQFNYTISYYYCYLFNLIDRYYKYINQKISINDDVYNDTLSKKKLEIKNNFEKIKNAIVESENNYLKINNQINILHINENDFFNNTKILTKTLEKLNDTLDDVIDEICMFEMFLPQGDQYSLVMRYYLENKELGKLIEKLYEPVDNGQFFYLDLYKFKNIVTDNWIFDKENFVNILNNILYETDIEIKKELNIKIDEYTVLIQNELNEFFSETEKLIIELFKTQINNLTSSDKNKMSNIITDLLYEFELKMEKEALYININSNSVKIQNYINNYKDTIKKNSDNSIFDLLDKYRDNIYKTIYSNFVEEKTKIYLNNIKALIAKFNINKYNLLNSTFNISETVFNLAETIINNYKLIISKTIFNTYFEYYGKIKEDLNLDILYSKIDNDLDYIYKYIISPKLNSGNKCTGCYGYEFTSETTNYLDNLITKKTKEIKNEIEIIKNNDIVINVEINIDIKISSINVFEKIYDSLKTFLSFENGEQVTRINIIIQNVIKSNLEEFLNDIIPTYGDIFFERIIDYNIN